MASGRPRISGEMCFGARAPSLLVQHLVERRRVLVERVHRRVDRLGRNLPVFNGGPTNGGLTKLGLREDLGGASSKSASDVLSLVGAFF